MTNILNSYENYKKSCLGWVKNIPEHWCEKKLKHLAFMKSGETITADNINETGEYPVYGGGGLRGYTSSFTHDGDHILIGRQGALCGNIKYANGQFWASEHSIVVSVNKNVNLAWLGALLESMNLNQYSISAAQPGLSVSTIKNLIVPVPIEEEQKQIADFLDKKTTEIDSLIIEKEKFIKLLEEKRQAVITEAVTTGINPNVKLKDSGVQWLGEIPEHWEIIKMKYKFQIKKEKNTSEEPVVLSLTQRGLKIKDLSNNEGQHAESYLNYQKVNKNDFVMNSMDLLTGFVDCSTFEGVTSPDYRVFKMITDTDNRNYYLKYFQICYWNKIFYGHGQGVSKFGRWRLQADVFKEFPIPVPPPEEQKKICDYINEKVGNIIELIDEINVNIEKLKEYRQSLIYEAVTGKIDVRDYKVQ